MEKRVTVCDFHEDWVKIVEKGCADYSSLTAAERVWYNVQVLLGQEGKAEDKNDQRHGKPKK